MTKRNYNRTGIYTTGSKVKTDEYTIKAHDRWFKDHDSADEYRDHRNLYKRTKEAGLDASNPEHLKFIKDNRKISGSKMGKLLSDSRKMNAIRRLIEENTPTSEFIIQVLSIVEEES